MTLTRTAYDSDSTNMTWAHHRWWIEIQHMCLANPTNVQWCTQNEVWYPRKNLQIFLLVLCINFQLFERCQWLKTSLT